MTAISSALELLNSYIASNDEALLAQLKDALLECDNTDSSLHDSFFKQCKKEFGEKLWNCLDGETQELIIGSFADFEHQKKNKLNVSSSFSSIASSFEAELKSKIFNDFNTVIKEKIDNYNEKFDQQYVDALTFGNFVPAAMMVSKLKYMKSPKGISKDLRSFLEDYWDIYSLSDDNKIDEAFELISVRNDNAHGSTNKQYDQWQEVKEMTVRVLRWFIFSCDYFN